MDTIETQGPPGGEDRSLFLGASDMGAVLGVDPYKTPLALYEEKVGLAPTFTGNQHTRRGTELEAIAAAEWSRDHGLVLRRVNQRFVHPMYPFITGRADRRVVGHNQIAEIKCPSLGAYSRIKRTGLHEGYIAQLQTYLGLTQTAGGWWIIFCADQWEATSFSIDYDAHLYAQIIDRAASFWLNHVVPRIPPSMVAADEERVEIARSEGAVPRYDFTDNAEFTRAAAMLDEARKLGKEAALLETEARTRVLEQIEGKPGVYVSPGVRLSYTEQAGRRGFDAKALANAKPLDRLAVGLALQPLFHSAAPIDPLDFEAAVAEVGKAALDLAQFQTQGKPFSVLRLTTGGGTE